MRSNSSACSPASSPYLRASGEAWVVVRADAGCTVRLGHLLPDLSPTVLAPPWVQYITPPGLGFLLWCQTRALMQMVLTVTCVRSGQVRAAAGAAGAGFDVLRVGVRCILGDWPDKVCSCLPGSWVGTAAGNQVGVGGPGMQQ